MKVRRGACAFALCVGLLTGAVAARGAPGEAAAIRAVMAEQQAAWNRGDAEDFMHGYKDAPDTVAMLNVPVYGLDGIRSSFRANFPDAASMGTLEESDVTVRSMGETFALATGRYKLSRTKKAGGEVSGTFSEIMEKTPEGWRVIFSENQ